MKEENILLNNEVDTSSAEALGEDLKALRFAFAILYTQLEPNVRNGIKYQLDGIEQAAAKRLCTFLNELNDVLKS